MKSEKLLSLEVFKIHQREKADQAIYISSIKAAELTNELFYIDAYKKGSDTIGYQRQIFKPAKEKIKKFILGEVKNPILPGAIIVSSRSPLEFIPSQKDKPFGVVNINNRLNIIDGQHRFQAIQEMVQDEEVRELIGNFEVALMILSNFTENEEIAHFYVINSRQKKIPTDLAQRHLLALSESEDTLGLVPKNARWQLLAVKVIDFLNETPENIWHNRIKLPSDGDDKETKYLKLIGQAPLVNSMKPFFVGKQPLFNTRGNNESELIKNLQDILFEFWNGPVLETYPFLKSNPKDYLLMKAVGAYSLHSFLRYTLRETKPSKRTQEMNHVKKLLQKAASHDFDETFWKSKVDPEVKRRGKHASQFSSTVGYERVASGLALGQLIM